MPRAKRTERGYFEISVTVGFDEDGKRIRKRIRSKSYAEFERKRKEAEMQAGYGIATPGQKPTLKAFLHDWLEQVIRPNKRPSTYRRYEMDVRNHINPHCGGRPIDKVTARDVQLLINKLHAAKKAPRTIRNVRATLREALNTAVTWKLVRENAAVDVELPKARKPKVVILTAEQARKFLAAVQGDRLEALYWIALLGLRQGEILALEWKRDIDLEQRTITINGAAQRIKRTEGTGKMEFVPTKTEAGQRSIPLPEVFRDILIQHRARQDLERRREDWKEHDLVFPSERGTYMEPQNVVNRSFKPALQRAGLPDMRFHDLRHSTVKLLLSLGVDLQTVSAIAGHTSPGFTLSTYGREVPEEIRSAMNTLGSVLVDGERVLELPTKAQKPR